MTTRGTVATLVNQEAPIFCGPAAAQMVLQCTSAAAISQNDLWKAIKAASTGQGPPSGGAIGGIPAFNKQHCITCQGTKRCWASAPAALRTVINASVLAALAAPTASDELDLITMTHSNRTAAVSRLVKSVNRGIAPAFLATADHWCVVEGYEFGNPIPNSPATMFGGVAVVGFYVLKPKFVTNPANYELPAITMTAVETFLEDFVAVECGPGFSNRHVAIVAKP